MLLLVSRAQLPIKGKEKNWKFQFSPCHYYPISPFFSFFQLLTMANITKLIIPIFTLFLSTPHFRGADNTILNFLPFTEKSICLSTLVISKFSETSCKLSCKIFINLLLVSSALRSLVTVLP